MMPSGLMRALQGRRTSVRYNSRRLGLLSMEKLARWRDFLLGIKGRGLHGVEFVVSDAWRAALSGSFCAFELGACFSPRRTISNVVTVSCRIGRAVSGVL
jgi:hypothetical protein